MKMVDKSFLIRFRKFMEITPSKGWHGLCKPKPLSKNTIHTYFTKLVTVLHCAYRDRLIPEDPTNFLQLEERTRKEHVEKVYLTEEELVKLTQTKCNNQYVADIFLFSCLTGLRYSDIITLRWAELEAGRPRIRLAFLCHHRQSSCCRSARLTILWYSASSSATPPSRTKSRDGAKGRVSASM